MPVIMLGCVVVLVVRKPCSAVRGAGSVTDQFPPATAVARARDAVVAETLQLLQAVAGEQSLP